MMKPSGVVIEMASVPGKPLNRMLTKALPCKKMNGANGEIPAGFEWDGSSVPWFPLWARLIIPRHRHPIASCRHDYRCRNARTKAERKFADKEFYRDVRRTSWWITAAIGYIGVRVGAYLGIGVRY